MLWNLHVMPVEQEERESLLLAGSPSHTWGETGLLTPPHPTCSRNTRRGKGFPANHSCRLKPCAPSKAPIALCGKRGGCVLEIEIYFSVFSEA